MKRGLRTAAIFSSAFLPWIAQTASAQGYPVKSLRLVVPFPTGGPNDILARVVAQTLTDQLGQQVVIDNRGGAGGVVGADTVAHAAPDGYTLLFGGTASLAINPLLRRALPYDAIQDFAPVSLVATAPSLLTVHPTLNARNIKDLIVLARAKPGQLRFASAGIGTPPHLAGELFKNMTGTSMIHVPHKGGAPALADLLAGQISMYFSGISSILPLVRDGKLRGIAVTSASRTAAMPDMPTIAESGVPGYEISNWYAVVAPAGTARQIIARLNSELHKALSSPALKKRFFELAADPIASSPENLLRHNRIEFEKWAKVIKTAGITPE